MHDIRKLVSEAGYREVRRGGVRCYVRNNRRDYESVAYEPETRIKFSAFRELCLRRGRDFVITEVRVGSDVFYDLRLFYLDDPGGGAHFKDKDVLKLIGRVTRALLRPVINIHPVEAALEGRMRAVVP